MKIKKDSVLYNGLVLTLSSSILQIMGFVYRIFLSDLSGAEGLGIFRIIMSAYMVIYSICLSGIILALSKITSEIAVTGNFGKVRALKNLGIKAFSVLFLICAIPIIFWNDFIAENILRDIRTAPALIMMLACIFLTGFENINKAIFIGAQKMNFVATSECTEQIIRMITVLSLLYIFKGVGYESIAFLIMLGMTISEIFSVLYLTICFRKTYGKVKRINLSSERIRNFTSISFPVALSALVNNLLSSADSILLPERLIVSGMSRSEALSELGIISGMTMPLIMLPIAIIGAVSTVTMPNISKSMVIGDKSRLNIRVSRAIRVTAFIGIPATAAIIPLSKGLAQLFFHIDIHENYMLMLGFSVIFIYFQIISGTILIGLGEQKITMLSSILGEILQVLLLWYLAAIPSLNIYGYIIAIIVAPMFVTFLNFYNIYKRITLKFSFNRFVFEPVLSGLCVYFWVRFIYYVSMDVFTSQIYAVFVASLSAIVVYLIVVKLSGIKIFDYLKTLQEKNVENSTIKNIFTFNMYL